MFAPGVHMSGGSLPSARHTILLITFAYHYEGTIRRQCQYEATCCSKTYQYARSGICTWGSDIWTSAVLQLYRTVRWWYAYSTYYSGVRGNVLTRMLWGNALISKRAVIIGDFSLTLEMVLLVFMNTNVAIVIEHELQCNVPGIRATTMPGT